MSEMNYALVDQEGLRQVVQDLIHAGQYFEATPYTNGQWAIGVLADSSHILVRFGLDLSD